MFTIDAVGAASGVESATVRSWLARAPGFSIGRTDGRRRIFNQREALALLVAGEIVRRGYGTPSEVLPIAWRIAATPPDRTVWIHRTRDGELTFSTGQPHDVAVAIPLAALAARLPTTTKNKGTRT